MHSKQSYRAEQLTTLRLVPVFVRSQGEIDKGLQELQNMGALPWPNPSNAEDLVRTLRPEQDPTTHNEEQAPAPVHESMVEPPITTGTKPTPAKRRSKPRKSAMSLADFLGLERRFAGVGLVPVVIGGSTIDSCTGAGACSSLCVVGSCSGLRVRTRSSALLGFGHGSAPMFCSSWSPLSISPCEWTNTGTNLKVVSCSARYDCLLCMGRQLSDAFCVRQQFRGRIAATDHSQSPCLQNRGFSTAIQYRWRVFLQPFLEPVRI